MSIVRVALGRFDPGRYDEVRKRLDESRATLIPAIRALRGLVGFWAAIDRENSAMSNISIWETLEDSKQMDTLAPMIAEYQKFQALGVRFERPNTNHKTLWAL